MIMAVALVVRVSGKLVDGLVRENMGLVCAGSVMLVLFIVGVFIERGRRNQIRQAACVNETPQLVLNRGSMSLHLVSINDAPVAGRHGASIS
jgi:hypothetical protein